MKRTLNKKQILNLSQEYSQANFALVISSVLTVVLLLNSIDFTTQTLKPVVFGVFLSLCTVHMFATVYNMDYQARPPSFWRNQTKRGGSVMFNF